MTTVSSTDAPNAAGVASVAGAVAAATAADTTTIKATPAGGAHGDEAGHGTGCGGA